MTTADQGEAPPPIVNNERCTICDTHMESDRPPFTYGGFPLCAEDALGMASWLLEGGAVDGPETSYAWLESALGEVPK